MAGRMLIGIGSACAFISCLKLATDWFAPHYFPLIAGIANMMGTLGATFSGKPLATLVNNYGWQNACFGMALVGLIVAPLVWILVQDKQRGKHAVSFKESFLSIAKTKQIWLIGLIGGALYLPITAFAELWGVPYIMKVYGINNQDASQATVMIFIGMAIGGPVFSYIAHFFRSYKTAILICAVAASSFFVALSFADHFSYNTVFIILFGIGFAIGGQVLAFTVARNNTSDAFNGTAMGFTNGLISLVGLIFQPFLGKILDIFWTGEIAENGVRIYSLENYRYAIFVLAAALIISVIMLVFVKDNYKKTA
jgi:predicted MFS family arabinose efflux permease